MRRVPSALSISESVFDVLWIHRQTIRGAVMRFEDHFGSDSRNGQVPSSARPILRATDRKPSICCGRLCAVWIETDGEKSLKQRWINSTSLPSSSTIKMRGERFVFTRGTPVIFGNFSIAPEGKITCTPPLEVTRFLRARLCHQRGRRTALRGRYHLTSCTRLGGEGNFSAFSTGAIRSGGPS